MAEIAIIAAIAAKGFATIQEGRVAEVQGRFAKDIAIRNQQALERQAKAEREAASIEERRVARQEKIKRGRQLATVGKSGVGLAGATLSALTDTAFQFHMDRNLALRRGLIAGRQLKQRGQIILAQGRFARSVGKQAKRLSFIKATGTVLGGMSFGSKGAIPGAKGAAGPAPAALP